MTSKLVLAAITALLVGSAPAASASGLARVWIADEQPLVVRGSGFHDAAKVSVVVAKAKRTYRMTTLTSTTGAFTARFHSDLPTRCGTVVVTATDANGQRAISRIVANDCGGIKIPTKP